MNADKGLGPCAVTYLQYVAETLVHLLDENIYWRLSEEEATAKNTKELIINWISDWEYTMLAMSENIEIHLDSSNSCTKSITLAELQDQYAPLCK